MHENNKIDLKVVECLNGNDVISKKLNKAHGMPNTSDLSQEEFDRNSCFRTIDSYVNTELMPSLRISNGNWTNSPTADKLEKDSKNANLGTLQAKKRNLEYDKDLIEQAISSLKSRDCIENRLRWERGERTIIISYFGGSYVEDLDYSEGWEKAWEKYLKNIKDKLEILYAWKDRIDALIAMYTDEIESRDKPETVSAIVKEAQELVKEHKRLTQKVRKVSQQPIKELTFKDAKIFVEGRERIRIIESELHTLHEQFKKCLIPPDTKFPSKTAQLSSKELHNRKEIQDFYRKESEKLSEVGGTRA